MNNNSIEYYEQNAKEFISGTLNVDMSAIYNKFLQHIPLGGSLLDVGCGCGRDTKYFLKLGYQVTAMDGSPEMVTRATELTGLSVQHQQFHEIDVQDTFDGIWSCASILHVEKSKMAPIINILRNALTSEGVLYLSYKYGEGEVVRNNRHFSNYTEQSFNNLLEQCEPLQIIEVWITGDARPERQNERWLNVLLRKQ